MAERIRLLGSGVAVAGVYWQLLSHPEFWNAHAARTADPDSPHHGLDDIWCRFAPPAEGLPEAPCEWYPAAAVLGVKALCLDVMRLVNGTELGGVLITRIPPGATCRPHTDTGWHAEKFQKFGLQIASAPGQRFCFEGESLETKPGDVFWFDNAHTHWVTNDTPYERVTLIVCARVEE